MRRELAQLVCAVFGVLLGLLTPLVEAGPDAKADQVVNLLFTIGFGVISLVSIIYSVLFLVVQFSSTMFTPRLGLFREDPVVWRAFAFAIGVFIFCVTAALSIGIEDRVSTSVPAVAMLLALVALWLMRDLQTRAFTSIQLAPALTSITTRAREVLDALYVAPFDPAAGAKPWPTAAGATPVRWSRPTTVLQQIDASALIEWARSRDCVVALRVPIGGTLAQGSVVADVHGGEMSEAELRAAVVTGMERAFEQDPELAFRLFADIALRALSPAVNDPATAVQTLDQVEDLLTRLADRDLDVGHLADADGAVRVVVRAPDWGQYLSTAVDDLIVVAAASPMSLRRLRTMLDRLLAICPEPRRGIVRERLQWVEALGSDRYPLIWSPPRVR
ncbi:DUF2254 domain-containing protein [Streptomyces sp. Je 1-79]|uniref:DUF2254 domain-containing protein n=1 Tax=Streptomyces sp. Je 1-79 TaxID=2943847 RepID=UPI0021A32AA9|nr:DUF2254 domain-containing protein [Streptomyces sp. Je 1-79]MCT4352017.1 DUF2254 domain-containing protein [Streptomyces sp. Je 1-79]